MLVLLFYYAYQLQIAWKKRGGRILYPFNIQHHRPLSQYMNCKYWASLILEMAAGNSSSHAALSKIW